VVVVDCECFLGRFYKLLFTTFQPPSIVHFFSVTLVHLFTLNNYGSVSVVVFSSSEEDSGGGGKEPSFILSKVPGKPNKIVFSLSLI
jgi:hypothetical protein